MGKIRPAEFDERSAREDVFVLDIRPRKNYRDGHISGSHNVPVYDDLRGGDASALRSHLDEIPKDREVVTVCKAGVVARRATSALQEDGYEATTLAGGMRGWRGYENNSLGYRAMSLLWRVLP